MNHCSQVSYCTNEFSNKDNNVSYLCQKRKKNIKLAIAKINKSEDEDEEGAIKLNNDVWGDSDKEFYAGLRYVLSVYC